MMGEADGHFEVQIQNRNLPIVYPTSNIRQYPNHHQTFPPPPYLNHYGQGGVYPIQHPFYRMGQAYPVSNVGPRFHQYPNQHQFPNQHGYKHTKEYPRDPRQAEASGLAASKDENVHNAGKETSPKQRCNLPCQAPGARRMGVRSITRCCMDVLVPHTGTA